MPVIEIVICPVPLTATRFSLKEGPNLLGRDAGCDVEVPDPRISSKHCIILVEGEKVEFIDQNSTNGIFMGGQRTRKGIWPYGTTVIMGSSELKLLPGPARDMTKVAGN